MAKGYLIAFYRSVENPETLAAYAELAVPAITAQGGRFLVRGMPVAAHEAGLRRRVVVVEFDSVHRARAAYESSGFQAAVKLLGDSADRDVRIVEGLD